MHKAMQNVQIEVV